MIPDDLINRTLEKISRTTAAYNYFFNNINNPAWLLPLKERGFFTAPPPAIRENGYIQFPLWPESGYLLRVADKAPDEVLAIIKSLPDDIDNERVMDDVVNALLKIDPAKAARLTETVKKYTNSSQFLMLHMTASEFVCKLADAKHVGAALGLTKEMLDVLPDPEQETKLKNKYVKVEPTIKYRGFEYRTIVEKVTPSLTKAAPLATIDMYAELLNKAIAYEFTAFKEGDEDVVFEEKKDDFSYISRSDIAEDNDHNEDAENILITALRDSVVALMRNDVLGDADKLAKVKELVTNKYTIFKRIVEFALREYKDNKTFKPFYDSLIKDEKLISILQNEKSGSGKTISGFVTEKPTNLLKDLSDPDLVDKLSTYKDESGWSFERDSMSKELGTLVKNNPKRFVPLLKEIAATKNEYFDETIRAFTEVANSLDENSVINILTALTELYKVGNSIEEDEQRDYYSWSKTSSIRLIEKLVSKNDDDTELITVKSLIAVTELLLFLCRDEDPSGQDDTDSDPVNLSVNSIRGKALHAVAYLLAWMNRNKVGKDRYNFVFEELNWHLNPDNDPSLAIRSVYGWHFELLYGTDVDWVTKNIDVIYSNDELGNIAFDAYMMFNRVHEEALAILGTVFRQQLSRLSAPPSEGGKAHHDGLKNFVQHLALHYWYSSLDLSDSSMMSILLKTADKKYVRELANFIGFRLYKSQATKTDDAEINKLVELWEAIVQVTKDNDTKIEVLEEFGTWFSSGKFDPVWSLEQLTYAALKAGNIHLDFAALEYIETLAEKYPEESIKALSAMVDGTKERWAVSTWSKSATAIMQTAYKSDSDKAKTDAMALANKLVAKDYTEYRNVLSGS